MPIRVRCDHKAQSTQDAMRAQIKRFSFDIACVQCGHPHSLQQVPFACVALRVASCVLCGLGLKLRQRRRVPILQRKWSQDSCVPSKTRKKTLWLVFRIHVSPDCFQKFPLRWISVTLMEKAMQETGTHSEAHEIFEGIFQLDV